MPASSPGSPSRCSTMFGESESTRFRLAGVGVSNFLDEAPEAPQTELFPEAE